MFKDQWGLLFNCRRFGKDHRTHDDLWEGFLKCEW